MATPMSAAQFLSQLKKWKISYVEWSGPSKKGTGWKTHNRAGHGAWGPVHGVMMHHTGSDGDSHALLWSGRSDLPGPLVQAGLDGKGVLHLVGWGRCNHAGLGDDDVYRAVISEDYGAYPPKDNENNTDGNAHFYGLEIMYAGNHGMTPVQYAVSLKYAAAICQWHGWTHKSMIGHGEWQPGKWDPGYKPGTMMDMNAYRNDLRDVLKKGHG